MVRRQILFASLLLIALAALAQKPSAKPSPLAASMQKKLDAIQQNGARPQPDTKPTELTEAEVNAWLASGYAKLPRGVGNLHLTGQSGRITATARVDFDAIKEGRTSNNPLLVLFSGTHDVRVVATGSGSGGQATIHEESAEFDGIPIPRAALSFFLDRYVKPKHPEVGVDTTFRMPARVDTATVGEHVLVVTQK